MTRIFASWSLRRPKSRPRRTGIGRFGELDNRGHELGCWQETGLSKGANIYEDYLKLFKLTGESFADLSVCDFGCGPFGGGLSAIPSVKAAYPVDVLAEDFNEWGKSRFPMYPIRDYETSIPDGACDVCLCTNALDHVPEPRRAVSEIARVLKSEGSLYLQMHLREPHQLNKAHRYVVTVDMIRQWVDDYFEIQWESTGSDWVNDDPYEMFYAHLLRRDKEPAQ